MERSLRSVREDNVCGLDGVLWMKVSVFGVLTAQGLSSAGGVGVALVSVSSSCWVREGRVFID